MYCGSHEHVYIYIYIYIYISPICKIVFFFFLKIIKLGFSFFLFPHGIRAKGENLNFFFPVIVFPSGHFLLLPKPSRSPSDLLAAVAVGDFFPPTFSASSSLTGDLRFRGAQGLFTRQQIVAHAPQHADLLWRIESHVLARVGA